MKVEYAVRCYGTIEYGIDNPDDCQYRSKINPSYCGLHDCSCYGEVFVVAQVTNRSKDQEVRGWKLRAEFAETGIKNLKTALKEKDAALKSFVELYHKTQDLGRMKITEEMLKEAARVYYLDKTEGD